MATTVWRTDSGERNKLHGDLGAGFEALLVARDAHDAIGAHQRHQHARATRQRRRHHTIADLSDRHAQELLFALRADDLARERWRSRWPRLGRPAQPARQGRLDQQFAVMAAETG